MFGFYNNAQMVLHFQDHYWGRRPSKWLHINCWYGWFWWSFPQSRVHWKLSQLDSSKELVNGRWIWSWISTNEWSRDSGNYSARQRGFKSVTHAQACAAFECALEWLELQGDIQTQLIWCWSRTAWGLAALYRVIAAKQIQITSYVL